MNPIVIDPPGFDQDAAWKECRDYVDQCGGMSHEDGEVDWRAAFGADPGICSCPACNEMYWMWGRRQRCVKCGYEYPTDAWPMFSYGAQNAKCKAGEFRDKLLSSDLHQRRLKHPWYRYGFENPPEGDIWKAYHEIDWRKVFP